MISVTPFLALLFQQLLMQISPKMETEDFSDATVEYNLSKNRYASKVAGICITKIMCISLSSDILIFSFNSQVTTAEYTYDEQDLKDLTTSMPTLLM